MISLFFDAAVTGRYKKKSHTGVADAGYANKNPKLCSPDTTGRTGRNHTMNIPNAPEPWGDTLKGYAYAILVLAGWLGIIIWASGGW